MEQCLEWDYVTHGWIVAGDPGVPVEKRSGEFGLSDIS